MTWFKVDDSIAAHAKARRAGLAAMGLWTMAGAHCGQQLTDGFVEDWFVRQFPSGVRLAGELVKAGLFEVAERDDAKGWVFHDWSKYQPSAASVKARREAEGNRQKVQRDPALREAVQSRDRGCCRYCGLSVRWNDRKGDAGGTYDHVNPHGDTSLANVVVACRGCNRKKAQRTPRQAAMALLDPGEIRSVLDADQVRGTEYAEGDLLTPQGSGRVRVGNGPGSGSGREGPHDELDPPSWDPADYELPDLSGDR